MKLSATILSEWREQDPDRLLKTALRQAKELEEVVAELEALRSQNVALHQQLQSQQQRIQQLEEALQAAQVVAYRQAAPFRIPEHKHVTVPKAPGRKAGHPGTFRPRPDRIDEAIEVALCSCPHCGGQDFTAQARIEQFIEEVAPLRPRVTRLRTFQAICTGCGQTVRSSHPLQMSLASGAAGVQLGPNALALAADLNKAKGLSMRKTCAILRDCFALQLSPGGLSQALDRLALKVQSRYETIAQELRQAPVVHSDETSWWVGGPGWWLWVFTNAKSTLYLVDQSRARGVVTQLLGLDFAGVLVSDCLAVYDHTTAFQQKCYAHHHKAIGQAKALHPQAGEGFLNEVAAMLHAAVALQQQKAEFDPQTFSGLRQALQHKAAQLLDFPRSEPNEEAVRNRLAKQRDHLFTFLDHDGVDATNNLAERQLRPAVIARKISCGNKTKKGAHTWQILASLAATCAQRSTSFMTQLARAAPLQPR